MFPFNSSQRAAFDGLRREFEQAIGVQPEMPRGVAVFDANEALIVEIDVPGVAKSDIEMMLEKDTLTIRGERKAPEIEANVSQDFRSLGRFEHVFRLGFSVDPTGVDAVCEDGVLRITLAKAPQEQPKRIDVRERKDSEN